MAASWFVKQGYEVADTQGIMKLVWKSFSPDAEPPRWVKGSFQQELVVGKVKVTSFFSGQCPAENGVHFRAQKTAAEYGDRVVFEEINMSFAENRKKYGLLGGLFINGENIFSGPPPSSQEIKSKIDEKLRDLP